MTGGRWAATASLAVSVTLVLFGQLLLIPWDERPLWGLLGIQVGILGILAYSAMGALVVWRRAHPIGAIFSFVGVVLSIQLLAYVYAERALVLDPGSLPYGLFAAWIGELVWLPALVLSTILVILLFPDGRLPSRRWRPVVWLASLGVILVDTMIVLEARLYSYPQLAAPLSFAAPPPDVSAIIGAIGALLTAPALALSLVAIVLRFRAARGAARLQFKWFAYAATVVLVTAVLSAVSEPESDSALRLLPSVATLLLPVAVGVAILRYHLYDIDLIINRTLVYGSLSATLGAVYVGLVIALQGLLSGFTAGNMLAVAGSTLVAAALFQPARRRIQAIVDRHFYRSRYDAQQTVETFSSRLRHGVDLDLLADELRDVVEQTLRPASVSVWLQSGAKRRGEGAPAGRAGAPGRAAHPTELPAA
jgi:hypothetical protein